MSGLMISDGSLIVLSISTILVARLSFKTQNSITSRRVALLSETKSQPQIRAQCTHLQALLISTPTIYFEQIVFSTMKFRKSNILFTNFIIVLYCKYQIHFQHVKPQCLAFQLRFIQLHFKTLGILSHRLRPQLLSIQIVECFTLV